jgi:hypothetical protein
MAMMQYPLLEDSPDGRRHPNTDALSSQGFLHAGRLSGVSRRVRIRADKPLKNGLTFGAAFL